MTPFSRRERDRSRHVLYCMHAEIKKFAWPRQVITCTVFRHCYPNRSFARCSCSSSSSSGSSSSTSLTPPRTFPSIYSFIHSIHASSSYFLRHRLLATSSPSLPALAWLDILPHASAIYMSLRGLYFQHIPLYNERAIHRYTAPSHIHEGFHDSSREMT